MGGPVYGLWLANTKEAFFQLSQAEKDALMAKRNANLAQVGGKDIPGYKLYAAPWELFGIVEYPNAEALREHELFCNSLDWRRYFEMTIMCGEKSPE